MENRAKEQEQKLPERQGRRIVMDLDGGLVRRLQIGDEIGLGDLYASAICIMTALYKLSGTEEYPDYEKHFILKNVERNVIAAAETADNMEEVRMLVNMSMLG